MATPATSFRNEAFSFFTHAAGALAGIVGLVLLVRRSEGALATTAYAIYGATLVAMFASSTLHHVAHRDDGLFRRIDLTAIFLFIAGTYTPICLLVVPPKYGWPMLAVVWTLAVAGITLRWIVPTTPRWVTAGLYLGLGWIAVVGVGPLSDAVGASGVALLISGGLVYSIGAVVYAMKRPDPWPRFVGFHGLWHVFVMVAAGLHFALVWSIGG